MIKTIISILFTIYSLSSGNRRLLQIPPQTEPATPAEPAPNTAGNVVEPAPAEPVPAIPPPPAVLEPVIPSSAVPGIQQPPAAGTTIPASAIPPGFVEAVPATPATPTTPTGGNTGGSAITHSPGSMPWAQPQAAGNSVKTECWITPPAAGSCAQHPMIVSNPGNNWELQSNGLGAMYDAKLTIDIPPSSLLEEIAGFWFTEPYSGHTLEITINNPTGRAIGIATCECTEDYSCSNMVIYTGPDVFIEAGDFHCDRQKIGACDNCWVKKNAADVGMPCSAYA